MYDLIIVGAGPAGLACAIEAEKRGLDYLVIEAETAAGSIKSYDILHRLIGEKGSKRIVSAPEDLKLRPGLPFGEEASTDISTMLGRWDSFIRGSGVYKRIREAELVTSILKRREFEVKTDKGKYMAGKVILATGRGGSPRWLGIPGEKGRPVFHCYLDAPEAGFGRIVGKDVLVVGGGDAAAECALILGEKNRVTVSYRRKRFVRLQEKNLADITKMGKEGKTEIMFESRLREIVPGGRLKSALEVKGRKIKREFDFIFILIGTHPPCEFLDKIGVLQEERVSQCKRGGVAVTDTETLPIVGINGRYGCSIPGLYLAGDVLGRQKIVYASQSGKRELQRALLIRFAIRDGQEAALGL